MSYRSAFAGDAAGPIDAHSELPSDQESHWADKLSVKQVIDRRWRALE